MKIFKISLFAVFSFLLAGILSMQDAWAQDLEKARTCGCVADVFSKTYQKNKKTLYGSIRKWSCEYTCYRDDQEEKITGYHANWYMGKDSGREGVCDGVKLQKKYNVFFNDFIWTPEEKGSYFHPRNSTSVILKAWAKNHCE